MKNNNLKHWKTALICLAVLLSLSLPRGATASSTDVSGIIATDTTWTLANSPYIVTGNVLVNSGVTLTIEPGVTVKFNSGKAIQIDGTLIARGTNAANITFTSNQTTPAAGNWGYILFGNSSRDATYDTNGNYTSGSILEYAVVEYAGGSGAVQINYAHPFINYCTIRNNKSSGIYAYYLSSNDFSGKLLKITNNTILNNTSSNGGGICIYGAGYIGNSGYNDVTISNNIISYNKSSYGGGIYVSHAYYGDVTISNNIVSDNTSSLDGGGIYINWSSAIVSNNIISNNTSSYAGGIYIDDGSAATIPYTISLLSG